MLVIFEVSDLFSFPGLVFEFVRLESMKPSIFEMVSPTISFHIFGCFGVPESENK